MAAIPTYRLCVIPPCLPWNNKESQPGEPVWPWAIRTQGSKKSNKKLNISFNPVCLGGMRWFTLIQWMRMMNYLFNYFNLLQTWWLMGRWLYPVNQFHHFLLHLYPWTQYFSTQLLVLHKGVGSSPLPSLSELIRTRPSDNKTARIPHQIVCALIIWLPFAQDDLNNMLLALYWSAPSISVNFLLLSVLSANLQICDTFSCQSPRLLFSHPCV